ncbi:MAG: phosphoenolpyruvate synthase [Gemmatimonadales bacterium]|nr:MAG: phosphoenolpyruvate synthase [Gemmatimonadales bacterium]
MTDKDDEKYVRWFDQIDSGDTAEVGGKNASLGEMIKTLKEQQIRVPDGFATTAAAYRTYLTANDLDEAIRSRIDEFHAGEKSLGDLGREVRQIIEDGEIPDEIAHSIRRAYRELSRRHDVAQVDVAARSSATAEDLPEASFAGQQESYLNISGEDALLRACKRCFASLFTNRAIAYREEKGFNHLEVALSVGVQKMVRSDRAGAGVLFTLDTDSGFPDVVLINAAWGLGEVVVQGTVNPDQYLVYKPFLDREGIDPIIGKTKGLKDRKIVYAHGGDEPTREEETSEEERRSYVLSEDEIIRLARWSVSIEEHYGTPMDIEWAKDGDDGEIHIVQARPETVESRKTGSMLKTFTLKETGERLVSGVAVGQGIAVGEVQVLESAREIGRFKDGGVLVTGRTDPDWVPIMKRAAAIVTERGGRTSHAAIVSRELGIPALVGAGGATTKLKDGRSVTVSCAEGDEGYVYDGELAYEERDVDLGELPETRTRIMLNIAAPKGAMRWWRLPTAGVGLARMEYLINNVIQVHPLALTRFDELEDEEARRTIDELTYGYEDRTDYFVEHLARGIATIAASQYPREVIVRMSDFKTNEYADLIGGRQFEPLEENPMLGWRGASRYYSEHYSDGFALECRAIRHVRNGMGFRNVIIMIPFCRTPAEADRVLEVLKENGLERGRDGLQVYVMAEIPSNVLEAGAFAQRFDGFSIGSNDLTQLVLGISRDSEQLSELFDESDASVKRMIRMLIEDAHKAGLKVGICGEAPSNDPTFAAFLVEAGIDSISLSPDSVVDVLDTIAAFERG